MTTSVLIDALASYVPALLLRRTLKTPALLTEPEMERFPAAVLFADVSGFTALTEQLVQGDPTGVEKVTEHINTYFGELIALIAAHGGDVAKFAGDALVVVWPATTTSESLTAATHRAAQCALTMQESLNQYEVIEGTCLSLRVGVGAGEVLTALVGGQNGRWEFLVAGEPLVQMGAAEAQAEPGGVVLSPEAWTLVQNCFVGQPLPGGGVRLESPRHSLPLCPNEPLVPIADAEKALLAYIPDAIQVRLAAGQGAWAAELRLVTVMFVNLPELDYYAPDALDCLHQIVGVMQTTLQQYEGSFNKFLVDDKGSILVAGFGLPPYSHEDDAVRGVQAALTIQAQLQQLGLRPKIGITTGRVYCGAVGCDIRREYTMLGDVVNLSARLMQAATDRVLCDRATYEAAKHRLSFDAQVAIQVKGKANPIAIYCPCEQVRPPGPWWIQVQAHTSTTMVGRNTQRRFFSEKLQSLRNGVGAVVVVEGEAGIGKSRLVEDLLQQAQALGITSLIGAGNAIEKFKPYHVWRSIFSHLLDLDFISHPEQRQQHVMDWFELAPESVQNLAPLLNSVLPLDLPENELTDSLSGQVRAQKTRELLVQLLEDSVKRSPKVLVLEDAHWMDSASWALALAVSQQVQPLLLVIATRSITEILPAEYTQLLHLPITEQLKLEPLPASDAVAVVCQSLGVRSLPTLIAELLHKRAQGNPFFCQELAYSLREAGLIVIADGECHLAPGVKDFSSLTIPDTVQGVITSRIDRLTPAQQLTLKVASVVGRVFPFVIVNDVYPIQVDKNHLLENLEVLERFDLTPLETPAPNLTYVFKHIITQEVAYNLMLFAHRRWLHRAVAEWYEQTYGEDLSPFYTLLAHHWSKAEVAQKAIDYLEKAGEQAVRSHALVEAVCFFSEAIDWLLTLPDTPERQEQELRLQIAISAPLMATKGFSSPEVEQANARARQLCQVLGATPQLFQVLWGQWAFYFFVGTKLQTSREVALQLLSLTQNLQDLELLLEAHYALGSNFFHIGEFAASLTNFEQGFTFYDRSSHPAQVALYGYDKGVACLGMAAHCLWYMGYPDKALTNIHQALTLARELSHPFTLVLVANLAGWLHVLRRESEAAKKQAETVIAISSEQGFPAFLALGKLIQGWAMSQKEATEESVMRMRQGVDGWRETGAQLTRLYHLALLAEGLKKIGRFEAGMSCLSEAKAIVDKTGECFQEAEVYRIEGELKKAQNGKADAEVEACFLRAINVAQRQGAKSLELRAVLSLSRLWQQQGKTEDARQMLWEIYSWFVEGSDMADLKDAIALLEELS